MNENSEAGTAGDESRYLQLVDRLDSSRFVDTHGPACLRDRGLLATWYVLQRLQEEMIRARRTAHRLTLAILHPVTIGDPRNTSLVVFAAVAAAQAAARDTDLVGWLEDDDVIVVMPDTDVLGAKLAMRRWQVEMNQKIADVCGLKWLASIIPNADSLETLDAVLSPSNAMILNLV